MRNALMDYILTHTYKEVGSAEGEKSADVMFFKVVLRGVQGEPDAEQFRKLTTTHKGIHNDVDPLDGKEHSYIALGGWLGDQGLALQYMGLGTLLGVFTLLTPKTMLGIDGPIAMQMAQEGLVTVQARDA